MPGITQKLQGRTIDVIDAYQNVNRCIQDIELLRENVEKESDVIFKQAVWMADQINVEPNTPRVGKKQIYRDNVPANSPEGYYEPALVKPIVNSFILEMTHRFNKFNCKAGKWDVVDQELLLWQCKWLAVASKDRPDTLAKATKECDEESFPNLFVLLKTASTFPITSAEYERSFSAISRLRTCLRASMKTERLGSVAIMKICRQEEVDYKQVSELFFHLHPIKINLTNLLFDWIFWNLKKWTLWFIAILKIHHYNFIRLCK